MRETPDFLVDPADTRESIMAATYRALCEHGYAGLTIQRIAEQFEKSKSLLYHHYDDKDELLLEFLGFMLDRFETGAPDPASEDPLDRLETFLETMLPSSLPREHQEFVAAMVELRAQAAHDQRYRERFAANDAFFEARLETLVTDGVEAGVFRDDVEPGRVATLLYTTIVGAITRRVTTEGTDVDGVRIEVERYVQATLQPEGAQ